MNVLFFRIIFEGGKCDDTSNVLLIVGLMFGFVTIIIVGSFGVIIYCRRHGHCEEAGKTGARSRGGAFSQRSHGWSSGGGGGGGCDGGGGGGGGF